MEDDDLTNRLRNLKAELPAGRATLTEAEKDELVKRVGPRTARDIVKAGKELPKQRVPFLFSSVDTQAVMDLLANDMKAAIARALRRSS